MEKGNILGDRSINIFKNYNMIWLCTKFMYMKIVKKKEGFLLMLK